ncbi:MAG: helix-turn-helix transcriptional regulator [Anaerolineales bacterium]|nr:helix-turn-helix transcriptional regulator [Anaerolineales bacterium]
MDVEIEAMATQQADICGVFANPKRILILWTLAGTEKSVGEIATAVNTSLQNTSQHLRIMKKKGILCTRRDAQTIYYRINGDERAQICQLLVHAHQKKVTIRD